MFYDLTVKSRTRNRFSVGINKRFMEKLTGEIYYKRQTDERARPGDFNIIGISLRANLDIF